MLPMWQEGPTLPTRQEGPMLPMWQEGPTLPTRQGFSTRQVLVKLVLQASHHALEQISLLVPEP